jgi:hypothetical protein
VRAGPDPATGAHAGGDRLLAHITFLFHLAALIEAIARLRHAQHRLAQAAAAVPANWPAAARDGLTARSA